MLCSKPSRLVLVASLLLFTSVSEGQDKDATPVTLQAAGGVSLAGTYWESSLGKESAVLVLLHGESGNRKKWAKIAEGLQKKGYAVLTVDLRKHGESAGAAPADGGKDQGIKLKPIDYQAMAVNDMDAVKAFLMEKHHAGELNVRRTGFVAIGSMGAVALGAAGRDWQRRPYPDGAAPTPTGQDVRSIVLISPDANVKGIKTNDAVRAIKGGAMATGGVVNYLVFVGNKDKDKKKSADRLVKTLRVGLRKEDAQEQVILHEFPSKLNGEDLVARDNRVFLKFLTEFHDGKLKTVTQPWRDRHNKLNSR